MVKVLTSAKEFFQAANGKQVIKRCSGVLTVEDWPEYKESIVSQLLAQGANEKDIEVSDDKVSIGTQFWLKPKVKREHVGLFKVFSKRYEHDGVRGDLTGFKVEGNAVSKTYDNGMTVSFEILS
ncbi:hypothetical protein [Neptuniibacter sp. QD37_11]|uniref:hypothetical protein n=1 Tax=Neptuniibacter sp. QD37_11 TaxID=3398209 RepID=UPI0039F463A6